MIDVCKACTFVWFDPAEYDAMPRCVPSAGTSEQELPPEARRLLAMEQIKDRREQARLDKTAPDEWWKIVPALLGMPVEFDYKRIRIYPVASWLIAAMIFVISIMAFVDLQNVVDSLGLIPAEWSRMCGLTFLTSFFIHGDLFHVLGNLYFLLVFGDNVEEHLGSAKYVLLLLLATFFGGLVHILANPASTTPCIGASGGISALLAYYALQFPNERVGFLFWFRWVRFPVLGYVAFWIVLQVAGTQIGDSNVAHEAHLGGAAAGLACWLMQKNGVKAAA